jgi:hypothetical protein
MIVLPCELAATMPASNTGCQSAGWQELASALSAGTLTGEA